MLYLTISLIIGAVLASIVLAVQIVFPLVRWVYSYIDDADKSVYTQSYINTVNNTSPFGHLVFEKNGGFERHYDYQSDYTYTVDPLELAGFAFMNVLLSAVIGFTWPVSIVVGVVWGVLYTLRTVARTGKKVSKLANVAHTHPDSVEYTLMEDK